MRKKIIYLTLIATMLLASIPAAQAAPWSLLTDEQLKQNAVTELKALYPVLEDGVFTCVIASGWEWSWGVPLHKHIDVTVTYGYENTGSASFPYLRSYNQGGIHIFTEDWTDPEVPELIRWKMTVSYVDNAKTHYWNGRSWEYNEPYCYRNPGKEPMTLHFTEGGYDRTYVIRSRWCLVIYIPSN